MRPPEEPIRAELFSLERLEQYAVELAGQQRVKPGRSRGRELLKRVRENRRVLNDAYRQVNDSARKERTMTPAAEWLVDNFFVVDEQIREIIEDLPPGFYHQLPKLQNGDLQGYPRVFAIAWTYIAHTDSRLDSEGLKRFIKAYQTVEPLEMGEIWALAISLRIVLVENLRRLADRMVQGKFARQQANQLADSLLNLPGGSSRRSALTLDDLEDTPVHTAFVVQLIQRLRDQGSGVAPVMEWLDKRLADQQTNAEEIVRSEHQSQTGMTGTIRNIITSMRMISTWDWSVFVEDVAVVDAILRESSAFGAMDFTTRDLYRHAVEELSRGSRLSEVEVTYRVLSAADRARKNATAAGVASIEIERQSDPGYHLVSAGRYAFENEIGFHPSLHQRVWRVYTQWKTFTYLGSLAVLTALIWSIPMSLSLRLDIPIVWGIVFALLSVLPASDLALAIVNWVVMKSLPPKPLPKLNFITGLPPEYPTLVVMPMLLNHQAAIQECVDRLEVHYLSNPEGPTQFALLTDWSDAPQEQMPADEALLDVAVDGINRLNHRYGAGLEGRVRFLVFHRRRLWNASEGVWMGWERKRGKLEELNRFLRDDPNTTFMAELTPRVHLRDVRYVITLDADTRMGRGAVYRLVGTMAHPLNRAQWVPERGRVTEGYGIIQPRITPVFPSDSIGSLFQQVYSGPAGIDPYAFAVSDVYQDLFKEGSYVGKGIYDVDVFQSALASRVPENRMLSHDLFEGFYARTALATDIEFYEEAPSHYEVGTARTHRWTRGDWQLVPWILKERSLPLISHWKMIDNLRRSLSPIAAFLTLILSGFLPVRLAAIWVGLILAVYAFPLVMVLVENLRPRRVPVYLSQRWRSLKEDVRLAVIQFVFAVVLLAHQAWVFADAIGRTLYRLLISRRHFLEWTSAAQARASADYTLSRFYTHMAGASLLGGGAGAAVAYVGHHPLIPILFAVIWMIAPWVAWRISLPQVDPDQRVLSDDEQSYLRDAARRSWRFFEHFVDASSHFLPPDNFQESPQPIVAQRTSPTNIGLYLLATLTAHDLGWVSLEGMVERLEACVETLQKLGRYRGHFYNWYDTHDLRPLEPLYVSTVDSGNLAGHLITLAEACRRISSDDLESRLAALAQWSEETARAMEFGFLLDPVKKLFSIGFQVQEKKLDPSFYDLLASEARLASFVAIAQGEVPTAHWFHLGRFLTPLPGGVALLSWSGSMFEYLMPLLVMRSPAGSLLDQTYRVIVRRQIDYAAAHGVPWGISESGYNVRDRELTYQYSNFGVPGLGLKRGLGEDLLIAPYATCLAAMVNPVAAVENLRRLESIGARGLYGFYEALDYTEERLPENETVAIVKEYMAHHQGMSLVALGNVLLNGIHQTRFHANPRIQAAELLLQERTPHDVPLARPRTDESRGATTIQDQVPAVVRRFYSPHQPSPRTHLLSNGRYSVLMTTAGSGYSRWRDLAVTRWREDATRDTWGTYIFFRDTDNEKVWSAGYQPTGVTPNDYEVDFSEERAEFIRRDGSFISTLEVIVSPEDDAEIRRVTLKNLAGRDRFIEITSYAEIALVPQAADVAHPAFSNLFVQTEFAPDVKTLLATRRLRQPTEKPLWAAHGMALHGEAAGPLEYETDRAHFLGRGRGIRTPQSIMEGKPLTQTTGAVLDPIMSLRQRVKIPPGQSVQVSFVTLVTSSREQALILADKYRDPAMFERTLTLAWTHAQVQQHYLGISPHEAHLFQDLASRIVYSNAALRPAPEVLARNTRGANGLWAHGISGDIPIVLVRIDDVEDRDIIRQMLRAYEYWNMKNLAVDLVIVNERATSYLQELQSVLDEMVQATQSSFREASVQSPGRIFLLRADRLTPEDRLLLQTAARMILLSRHGSLSEQLARFEHADQAGPLPQPRRIASALRVVKTGHLEGVEFFNGLGGFDQDGREYRIQLGPGQWTPAPWINVISNERFGFQVSESGSSYTWSENSRENQLTPWSNDPLSDPSGEVFYIRDLDTGEVWTPTALPIREHGMPYTARHGQGYSQFEYAGHEIALHLRQYVPREDPIKISRLSLTNRSSRTRRLSITVYVEWVLGFSRSTHAPFIITERDPETGAIFAHNPWNTEFGGRIAFADFNGYQTAWTADRTEFIGRHGTLDHPLALEQNQELSGRVGAGLDPCAVQQQTLVLGPGAQSEVVFFLGQTAQREEAVKLIQKYRGEHLEQTLVDVQQLWEDVLETVHVRTPQRSLDILVNRWLLYQTLACRVWARSAFYQAGGAYGFRDQLQDIMALVVARPDEARRQILRAAGRQFPEGDVQHWWHPPTGRGVRTHISDDRVWLPFVVSHYIEVTGDAEILNEELPFLEGQPIPEGGDDAYFHPATSSQTASVFEHCAKALDRSLAVGAHGLPLIGTGDWNDGMNRVGQEGKGESVWLAWFLHSTLWEFAKVAEKRGEAARAEKWRLSVGDLKAAIEKNGWDGEWYRRAYFDDGTPLGSVENSECRIDSIAQSWGVLSGGADPARAAKAMAALEEQLIKYDDQLALLLTPPFDQTPQNPGYIKGYLPGVRENGGQYTHAAVWAVLAFAALGQGEKAMQVFNVLNPIHHTDTSAGVHRYKVEPYVLAGDVYSVSPHTGRGGWTWYTGSAGWMYRAAVEWILGVRLRGTTLFMDPCIPNHWPGYEIQFRYHSARYEIKVENPQGVSRGIASAEMDGRPVRGGAAILLVNDGATHQIRIVLG